MARAEEIQTIQDEGENEPYDVTLIADKKKCFAHRRVLAKRSDFFKAMFFGNFSEKDKEVIELIGVPFTVLKRLINLAYSTKIGITKKNVCDTYETADYLQFKEVRDRCYDFMIRKVEVETCFEFWCCCKKLNLCELKAACEDFMCEHFREIIKMEDFYHLDIKMQLDFLSRNDLCISEYGLALVVCNIIKQNPNIDTNMREELANKVRYYHLTSAEMTELEKYKDLIGIEQFDINQSLWHLYHINIHEQASFESLCPPRGLPHLIILRDFDITACHIRDRNSLPGQKDTAFQVDVLPAWATQKNIVMVQVNKFLFCFGCSLNDNVGQHTYRFDSTTKDWVKLAVMNVARRNHAAVLLTDNIVIVIGGTDQNQDALSSVEMYNISRNQWESLNDSDPIQSLAACNSQGQMFISGGISLGLARLDINVYVPQGDRWECVGQMLKARFQHGMCASGDIIFMVGGNNSFDEQIECFNTQICQSSLVTSPTKYPRLNDCSVCTANGVIHVVSKQTDQVRSYIIAEDRWEYHKCLPNGSYHIACAMITMLPVQPSP